MINWFFYAEISAVTAVTAHKILKKNIFWTYGHQMMIIRRSAKTADEHQIIAGILIYFHHTINLLSWLEDQQWQYMVIRCSQELKQIINTRPPDDLDKKICKNNIYDHQVIVKVLIDYQHMINWCAMPEEQLWQHKVIRCLPGH